MHRQVGVGIMVTYGSLGGSLAYWPKMVDSHSRHNISQFCHTDDTSFCDHGLVQSMRCMVVEPALCIHVYVNCNCLYVCNCEHLKTYNFRRRV